MKAPATKKDYIELTSIAFDVNELNDDINASVLFCRSAGGDFISISIFDSSKGISIQPAFVGNIEANITTEQAINLLSSFLPEPK